jgi:hypothetical protein
MTYLDEMQNRTQYYKGIYPVPHYKPSWKLNEEIIIQIQTDVGLQAAESIELNIVTPTGEVSLSPYVVTPSGWQVNGNNGQVLNYYFTPVVNGDHQ